MFLDVRDPWPPLPPRSPPSMPEPAAPLLDKRSERIVGLVVAINLGLVLLAPMAGGSVAQAVASVFETWYR